MARRAFPSEKKLSLQTEEKEPTTMSNETYKVTPRQVIGLLVRDENGHEYTVSIPENPRKGSPMHSPEDFLGYAQARIPELASHQKEHFVAVFLDTRRHVLGHEIVSVGTLDSSLVHPREVFRKAIEHGASAVLVAHNHPSGNPNPSHEDLALTNRLHKAGHLLGIPLLDHLVLGEEGRFRSLRQMEMNGQTPVPLFS